MANITSGTVNATPLGDLWIGSIEIAPTADDGDQIDVSTLIGAKIKEVVFANGVRNSSESGSVDVSPIGWVTGSGSIFIGNSGTQNGTGGPAFDTGRSTLSNYRRDIFFVAKSQQ